MEMAGFTSTLPTAQYTALPILHSKTVHNIHLSTLSAKEKAERQERDAQFRRILDSLPEDDREVLKEMQTEAFRRAARENELYYREGLKDGFTVCLFVNGG